MEYEVKKEDLVTKVNELVELNPVLLAKDEKKEEIKN